MALRKNVKKAALAPATTSVTSTSKKVTTAKKAKAAKTPEVNFDALVEKHPDAYVAKKAKDATNGTKPKTKKVFEAGLDKKNLKSKVKEVKDLKYKYPKEVLGNPDLMKKFRVKARRENNAFTKQLEDAKPKEKKAIQAKYDAWQEKIYS